MPGISVVPTHGELGARARLDLARSGLDLDVSTLTDARGDYLLMLAPDDGLVPAGAATMLSALERSGSDLAVCMTLAGPAHRGPGWSTTSVVDSPTLLDHDAPSGTLWRRRAFSGLCPDWPAQPTLHRGALARALLRAHAVDVVRDPATRTASAHRLTWRSRRRPRSADLDVMLARLADLQAVGSDIEDDRARARWFARVVEPDVRAVLSTLPEVDHETRERLVTLVAAVLESGGPQMVVDVRAIHRLQYHLAGRGLVPELVDMVRMERSRELTFLRRVRAGDDHLADLPLRTAADLDIPAEVFRLDRELVLRARVEGVSWDDGLRLHVEGFAYIAMVDVDSAGAGVLRLALVRAGDGRRVDLHADRVHRPDVTADSQEAAYRYDWAGFRTSVHVDELRDGARLAAGTWRLEATVEGDGVRRTKVVGATAPGRVRHPRLVHVDGMRIVTISGRGTFVIEVDAMPVTVVAATLRGDDLVLRGELRHRAHRGRVELLATRASGTVALTVPARMSGLRRRSFSAVLPLADVSSLAAAEPDGAAAWTLRLQLPAAATSVPLRVSAGFATVRWDGEREVGLRATPHGRAELAVRPRGPVVESVRWFGDALELAGRWPSGCDAGVVLVSRDAAREHLLPVEVEGERFSVRFGPAAMPLPGGVLPLPHGRWLFVIRPGSATDDDRPLTTEPDVLASLPLRQVLGAKPFTITEDDGGLEIAVGHDRSDDERGAANQLRLRVQDFPRFVASGLRDEVLFESYESRAYADNARAVLEELQRRDAGLRARWVVVDGQTALPDGIDAVRFASRDYFEALARSRYLVVANYLPMEPWYRSPAGQVVVQTWHGAPFKRIGLDNPRWDVVAALDHESTIRRNAAQWDFLLSPNPTSTPILRRAFGYEGQMLETGYPRTDVFHSPDRVGLASRVRSTLGIPDGKRVVLYAPTMRDDQNYGGNRFSLDLQLDLEAARRDLGEDHVLLVRRHAKVVDAVPAADGAFAMDVSLWPDVNELLLATDVLVTDYSSLMFDFASTGRPMLFFTYDLADYRDRLRGLYFDAERMPGPHLGTSAEVVAAIRAADQLRAEHDQVYREFVAEFCVWDDGKAAARFVDQVFAADL